MTVHTFTEGELKEKISAAEDLYPWIGGNAVRSIYALFDRWDQDCSGANTPQEMKAQMDLYSSHLFSKIDTDQSGQVTRDEMKELTELLQLSLDDDELREEWEKMNTNNDDSIDRSELM